LGKPALCDAGVGAVDTDQATLDQRLPQASVLTPEDQLPNEVRELFGQVMKSMHGVQPQKGEDAVAASVRKMSNQEADDCAAHIVEIFGITCRELLNAGASRAEVVQLHSAEREHPAERNAADFDVPALIASN